MNTKRLLRAGWPALFLLPALAGQDPAPIHDADLIGAGWVAPLQRHDHDPHAALWSAGDTWKARFDDAFTFFPFRGADATRSRGWTWRTTAIQGGAVEIASGDDAVAMRRSDTVVEFARGPMVERYEVRPEGVAQSFHFAAPVGAGDLVVRGAIDSDFVAAASPSTHGALTFVDSAGRDVLRYGEAYVLDAAGRRAPIATAFDGAGIELRVPASWLAAAVWPVTIDPLTSATVLRSFADDKRIETIATGRSDGFDERMFAFTRRFAADDHDLYVVVMNDTFTNRATVFSDVADDHDTREVSLDYVVGAQRWAVAYDDDFAGLSRLKIYFHDGGVGNGAAGTVISREAPNLDFRNPSIGGRQIAGNLAFVAWQADATLVGGNGPESRVLACTVNATTRTFGAAVNLKASLNGDYDAERPCVSRASRDGDGWMVVWQEHDPDNANDDWDVIGQRVAADGTLGNWQAFGPQFNSTLHKLRPVVAGTEGRFTIAYSVRANVGSKPTVYTGDRLESQAFRWPVAANAATLRPVATVATAPSNSLYAAGTGALEHDDRTDSHWAFAWVDATGSLSIARLAHDGVPVETRLLESFGGPTIGIAAAAAVTFDREARRFVVVSYLAAPTTEIRGRHFDYGAAGYTKSGTGCVGTLNGTNNGLVGPPHAGSEFAEIRFGNGHPNVPTWLLVAFGPADLPLPGSTAGCRVLLDNSIAMVVARAGQTSPTGQFITTLALPGAVPSVNLFFQAVQLHQGELWTSERLLAEVR